MHSQHATRTHTYADTLITHAHTHSDVCISIQVQLPKVSVLLLIGECKPDDFR